MIIHYNLIKNHLRRKNIQFDGIQKPNCQHNKEAQIPFVDVPFIDTRLELTKRKYLIKQWNPFKMFSVRSYL